MGTKTEVRRGRPKKKENREKLTTRSVKLSPEESRMLETLRLTSGRSRSDILRDALRSEYDTYKKSQKFDDVEYYDHEYFDDFE